MLEAKDILLTTQKGNVLFERNNTSKEIVGIVVAKVENDVVWIGPLATRPKFQVIKSRYSYLPSAYLKVYLKLVRNRIQWILKSYYGHMR